MDWDNMDSNKNITTENLAYLAGLLDGDGSITLKRVNKHKASFKLLIFVANTNMPVLKWIQNKFGGKIYVYDRQDGIRKPLGKWHTFTNNAYTVLKQIYPYLIIKKEHAKLAINFVEKLNRDASWHEEYANNFKKLQLRKGNRKKGK